MSDFIRHVNFLSGSTIFEEFFSLFTRTKKKERNESTVIFKLVSNINLVFL